MNWRKISIWSGLGGLVFGTALYAVKKSKSKQVLKAEKIPSGIKRLFIELVPQSVPDSNPERWTQRCYLCEPTLFLVWHILPTSRITGKPGASGGIVTQNQGTQVYFVIPTLRSWQGSRDADIGQVVAEEAFYATLRISTDVRRMPLISQIARDYPLEFRKCLVGGSPNGIETGDILITPQAVLDYHFEMTEG